MLQNLSLRSYLLLLVIAAIGLSGLAYSQPQSAAIHMAQELAIAALMLVSGVMVGLRKTGQPEQADATFSVEQLRRFAEATAATTGPNVFSVLAQHAAQTLEAPYVLLLEKREDELLHLLAIASDSELNVDTIYATAGMPCEVVLRQGQFYCDRDLQQRFPADTLLKATNAKGYLGIAICGGDGEALGVLCLIDQQPLRNLQQAEDVLRIFASRAALEIERQRATAALQQLNADLEARVESRTAELWEREQFLQTVLDTFPVSVFWKDRQSVYLGANRNFLDNAGLRSAAELIGKTDYDLPWHREETEAYRADDAAVVASGTAKLNIAETQLQPDGSVLWLETNKLPLRSSAGAIIGVLGTYQDITARKQAELALQQSENRLRLIADSVCACISYVDAEQRYQFVNATYEAWFDQPKESILGCRVEALIGPVAYQQARSYVERALTGETVSYEMDMPYPRGGLRYISAVLVPDIAPAGKVQGYYALIHDITDLKQTQQRLAYSALHDPLTNLPNRRLLTKRIGLAIQQARQCPEQTYAVLLLDVDRFKVVNDSLGHAVGDQLLQAIAARLIRWVTDQDCVARLGGDEFMILLEDSGGPEAVTPLIEYILAESEQPVMIGGYEIFTGFSVGVVFGNAAYTSASDLIRDADIAMYRVKAAGGNGYQVFDRAMHAQVVERLNLETALRKALDQQEFAVHYQPIINLYDQQLVGFEALARWPHPTGQVVMPSEFIPVAEEMGLVGSLDRWVLYQACAQMAHWQKQGLGKNLRMGINLSAQDLRRPNLAQDIATVLAQTGLMGESITLEITESLLIENIHRTISTLEQLAAQGIRISIDDFGTGYSSLSYLHQLPIHYLKIDASFIQHRGQGHQVIDTIITLSDRLGLTAVAEGIETPEQLRQLQELGCGLGQGHLFSEAIAPADIEATFLASEQRT